jgi:uncharacterized protein (TIGR01619 family)
MGKKINYTEDWDFYMSNVDGVIGSIFVDLGLINIVPIADKSNLVWVSISMKNPRENGLPHNEENEMLNAMEDNIVNNITKKHNAIFVGRLTSDGKRHLYFYFDGLGGYEKTIMQSMSKYSTYQFDHGSKEDKEWDGYLNFLYPLPNQHQMIMSSRVIRNLEQQGDNLSKERMVDHFIYFDIEKDIQKYISKIEKQNFKVIENYQNDEKIYVLHIGRIDKVDYQSANDYVLYLWELANEHNGYYDGWGTTVEKD